MKFILNYIKRYRVTYISIIVVFIIGMLIGIFVTFKMPESENKEVKEYIETSIDTIKENNINQKEIFKNTLVSNLKFLVIVWILGCTVIASFTIYILMIYKGFIFGYIIMIVISILGIKQGINFLFPILILQNIIFLPIIFLLATSGIRMYKTILEGNVNIKLEIIRHCVIMLISVIFAIISSCVEAYFGAILLNFL